MGLSEADCISLRLKFKDLSNKVGSSFLDSKREVFREVWESALHEKNTTEEEWINEFIRLTTN